MIDPLTGAALADGLAGITAGLAGKTLTEAYESNMTDSYDTLEPGVHIGYGNFTSSEPAISGDTSGSIVNSNESDPSAAFSDYETAGGVIDSTTGGFI